MILQAPISTLRVALRTANGFTLELLRIHRGDRDFTDAIILATLVQSNSAPLAGVTDLQLRYAAFDAPVPDTMRRAISINAIAASLGLPFETVRRRTKRLIADGACEAVSGGVRLSAKLLTSPEHARALADSYAVVQSVYQRLRRADCLQLMELPDRAPPSGAAPPPVRIVWRAAADYFLRMMELLLAGIPNVTRAFIVLEVTRANTEDLSDTVRGDDSLEESAMVPDAYRRPVKASEVAAKLGLPHETVRRILAGLVEEGRCQRLREGFIVPAAVLIRPNVVTALGANFRNLGRMFGELADTGVLALWEDDAHRTAAARGGPAAAG